MRITRERPEPRTSCLLGGRLGIVPCVLAAGCLVPLPLEQQTPTDGGQMLLIKGANPGFGTRVLTQQTQAESYEINVLTNNPSVAGRLYLQGNGKCCELDPSKPEATKFLLSGITEVLPSNPGRYTIRFAPVVPCSYFGTVSPVFLVPIIASGGFPLLDPSILTGQGEIDDTHYWTVNCP